MIRIFLALLLFCSNAFAAITDGKFGVNQIFDVQYYWSGNTLNASNFIAPYDKNFQTVTVSSGQYFQFFASSTNPGKYGLGLYNSNGTLAKVVHDYGDITALGSGAIFYIGSGFFGNVISTAQGYSYGASATFTNMDTDVTSSDLSGYTWASTTPLASGQTAAPPAPSYGVNFTRITSYEWSSYTAGSQPVGSEQAHEAFDNDNGSKWFGFRSQGAWVITRLVDNSSQYLPVRAVQRIQFVTANDAAERDPTGYKLWGSINGTDWVLVDERSISLPAGRFAASEIYILNNKIAFSYYKIEFTGTKSGGDAFQVAEIRLLYDVDDPKGELAGGGTYVPPYQSEITAAQQSLLDAARARRNAIGLGNRIDLYSDGSGNTVTIEQVGNYNRIQGLGGAGTNAHVAGFGTSVNIKQGDTLSGRNLIELYVQGNGNNVTISQARSTSTGAQDGLESGGHIMRLSITGDVATYVLRQGNDGGSNSGHFLNYTISGSGGTHTVKQSNDGEKLAFINISGNNNNETVTQSGTGNHFLDLTLTGNGNSASITQTGSGSHKATINLANVGGASSLTLLQQGSIQQIYSISQQCANLSGCSVSVTQGTGP